MLMADNSKPAQPRLLIKEWRVLRELSQEELALKMGVAPSLISMLESNTRRWNAKHLAEAAKALRCEPIDLLTTDPGRLSALLTRWDRLTEDQQAMVLRVMESLDAPPDSEKQ